MIIYLVNISVLVIYGIIFLWYKPSKKNKIIFCVLASLNWILLSGLRHLSIGADTIEYKYSFNQTVNHKWSDLFNNFVSIIFGGSEGKDPGYNLFEKFIQIFTEDYQIYLIIIAMIFTVSLGVWIYRNSKYPFVSFLIYSCLFYEFFAITGHRQTIATAFVVLIGYEFIKARKFWPFLLLILVSYTIHKSSICFLPFYFIANKKITKLYLLFMACLIPFMFYFKDDLFILFANLVGYEDYINMREKTGTWTFTSLFLTIALLTFWRYGKILQENPGINQYTNALIISLLIIPLTFVNPNAMRVVQYFSIFLLFLIPELIDSFPKKEKLIAFYTANSLLLLLFVKNNPEYMFYWE